MNKVKKENKKTRIKRLVVIEIAVLAIVVCSYLYINFSNKNSNSKNSASGEEIKNPSNDNSDDTVPEVTLTPEEIEQERLDNEKKEQEIKVEEVLRKANLLAMGYDYEEAEKLILNFEYDYQDYEVLTAALTGFQLAKEALVPLGAYDSVDQINHIFFHSLVADTKKAFDGDGEANGYNYYMTTVSEFNEMMKQMYEDGYVLVSLHDVAKKITSEEGTTKYVAGDIMLPPDKKPFVLSQDDVNYYKYMDSDGFASRIVIDEEGRPTTEMIMDDGTVTTGDYDVVPALETFIAEHPDFSYKGAKGLLALTGYEGSLGYRTNDKTSPTYEQDREAVKAVANVLKEWGWEFASHSYGHRNMQTYSYDFIVKDSDRWMEEVGSLIGPTDILIFPYGIDIETTMGHYSSDKYLYLKSLGFDYYCGVFKDPWIQLQDEYVRTTRRPLDGQAMLQFPERLADLFDLSKVIDQSRPALK